MISSEIFVRCIINILVRFFENTYLSYECVTHCRLLRLKIDYFVKEITGYTGKKERKKGWGEIY